MVFYYARNASPKLSLAGRGVTAEAIAGRSDYAMNCGDSRNNEAGAGPPTGGAVGTIVTDMSAANITGFAWCLSVGRVTIQVGRLYRGSRHWHQLSAPAKVGIRLRYSMAPVAPIASARNLMGAVSQYETVK